MYDETEVRILEALFPDTDGAVPPDRLHVVPLLMKQIQILVATANGDLKPVMKTGRLTDKIESSALTDQIVELREVNKMTFREIGSTVGMTTAAVAQRYYSAQSHAFSFGVGERPTIDPSPQKVRPQDGLTHGIPPMESSGPTMDVLLTERVMREANNGLSIAGICLVLQREMGVSLTTGQVRDIIRRDHN